MTTDAGAPPLEEVVADAFAWVGSVGVETDGGRLWREGDVPYDDLYCGTAGVLLGCAEAVDAGGRGRVRRAWTRCARAGCPSASTPATGTT